MKLAKLGEGPEIFFSIQGEGKSIGRPSIFARTSLCNLHCVWCDTDYTWNWEGTRFTHQRDDEPGYAKYRMEEMIIELSPEEVADSIASFPCKNVILTGGEPMMQQGDWVEVMRLLRSKSMDYRFEVETNATYLPLPDFDEYIAQYNLSPKLTNSGNKQGLREKPKVLRHFAPDERAVFKFVISEEKDLNEVNELVARYMIRPDRVYLMPEGARPEALDQRRAWLIAQCIQYGYCFTDRLHVHIWGDKRGV
jgi:organic radical activating enzyme